MNPISVRRLPCRRATQCPPPRGVRGEPAKPARAISRWRRAISVQSYCHISSPAPCPCAR